MTAQSVPSKSLSNNLVYQSNHLVEACYSMTLAEKRLLLACICQLDSRNELTPSTPIKFSTADAMALFGGDSRNACRDLKVAVERLIDRKYRLITVDGDGERIGNWIHTADFSRSKGEATIYFGLGILPYISELKANFTRYRMEQIKTLSSIYAVRIYEILVMLIGKGFSFQVMEIDDLKKQLEVYDKYKQFGDFQRFVMKPAIDQINSQTDLRLEVKYQKEGRSFTKIHLTFGKKPEAIEAEAKRIDSKAAKGKHQKMPSTKTPTVEPIAEALKLTDQQITDLLDDMSFMSTYAHVGESMSSAQKRLKRMLHQEIEKFPDIANYL